MRFLYVAELEPERNSGAAGTLLRIAEALERRGHGVEFCWRGEAPPVIRHATASTLLELPLRQASLVAERLRRGRFDVVEIAQPYGFLAAERLRTSHPEVLFVNRTHGWESRVYDAYRRFAWDGELPLARRLKSTATELATRWICRRAAHAFHGVVAASSLCADFVRRTYALPAERVAAITYGTESTASAGWSGAEIAERRNRMLFVGNYLARKGARVLEHVLPRVAREHPSAQVRFVVNDTAVEEVRRIYEPFFRERLAVQSWTDGASLARLYRSHSILLFPSLFEGFGKTFLEAMAAGACVVGFEEGGLPDVARHEHDALYCPVGAQTEFARILDRALSDPAETEAIGARARERVRPLTWDRTAEELERFVEQLGGARSGRRVRA